MGPDRSGFPKECSTHFAVVTFPTRLVDQITLKLSPFDTDSWVFSVPPLLVKD